MTLQVATTESYSREQIEMPDVSKLHLSNISIHKEQNLSDKWDAVAMAIKAGQFSFRDFDSRNVLEPSLKALLPNVSDARVLDAGCGDGWLSKELSQKGAKVTAVDFSKSMVDLAKRNLRSEPINVQCHSIEELPDYDKKFDIIVCHMVLMSIPQLEKAVARLASNLTKDGRLVWSILHPCFLSLNDFSGLGWKGNRDFWNPASQSTEFIVDKYFSKNRSRVVINEFEVVHFHRPLEAYSRAMEHAGLSLRKLREPKGPEPEGSSRIAYYLLGESTPICI